MILTDTHAHIYLEDFKPVIDTVLQDAEKEGISKILMPAIDRNTHQSMVSLENTYPDICLSMMGLHPCSVKEDFEDELAIARDWLEKKKFVAIGETGLDFYWDKTFTDQQYISFNTQIDWALEFDLPVVIHSRNSIDECIATVKKKQDGRLKGVFHCFSGDEKQANEIIELGLYLGIGGVVTFKNSGLDKVMEKTSLQHVVLETDAPYLAPVPFRGKTNQPAFLKYVVEKLSILKNTPAEEIARITTLNATKLFRIDKE